MLSFCLQFTGRCVMKRIKALLLGVVVVMPFLLFGGEETSPAAMEFKPKQPEWRPKIMQHYPNGAPRLVLFYDENEEGEEVAVKQIQFFENNRPMEEEARSRFTRNSFRMALLPSRTDYPLLAFFDL
jgi:hypothetical protein